MAGVHVVTDSTASLPREAATTFGITIVPQLVAIGDALYHEPFADVEPLLGLLADAGTPVRVSVAPLEDFAAALAVPLDWGVEVVSIHGPSALLPPRFHRWKVPQRADAGN